MKKEGTGRARRNLEDEKRKELSLKAQRANQRLLNLERNDMKKYSYSVAEKYFEDNERKSNRFKENVKRMSDEEVDRELKAVDRFLNSASSTPARMKSIENKKLMLSREALDKAFENKRKQKMTDDEFDKMIEFFKNDAVKEKLFSQYKSSEQAIETIFSKDKKSREKVYSLLADADLSDEKDVRVKFLVKEKKDAEFLEKFFGKKLFTTSDYSPSIQKEDVAPSMYNIKKKK